MCAPAGNGGGGGGGDNGQAARDNETRRNHAINKGMDSINANFRKFDDSYYADFEKKHLAMAKPDIESQRKEANDKTLFGLARSGNLSSSTAGDQYGKIQERNNQAILNAGSTARTAASGLRSDVEAQRANLVGQLNQTADASSAVADSATQADVLTKPPTYSPITGIFADLTGQIAANEQARRLGMPGWGFGFTSPNAPKRPSVEYVV